MSSKARNVSRQKKLVQDNQVLKERIKTRTETRDKRQKDRGKRQKTKYEKKILKESDQTGKKIRYSKKSYCQNTKKVNSKRDIQ